MFESFLNRVVRPFSVSGSKVRKNRPKSHSIGSLDALESRLLMTVRVWDGGGGAANNGWKHAANWVGNVRPAAGDSLVFPNTAAMLIATNDFTTEQFTSLSFTGGGVSGFTVKGNQIKLTGPITAEATSSLVFDVSAPLHFVGPPGQAIGVGAGSKLNFNSVFSSVASHSQIRKQGAGDLFLSGNNTFTADLQIEAGVVHALHSNALGSTSRRTLVLNGAALHLEEFIPQGSEFPQPLLINEEISIAGTGINNTGALRNVSGNNKLTNRIFVSAAHENAIGVDANDGSFQPDQLTIAGSIKGTSDKGFHKRGTGRLILSGNNTYAGPTLIEQGAVRILTSTALGTVAGVTEVSTGAALELDETEIGGGETLPVQTSELLRLRGTGIANTGALRNIDGSNSWLGSVTLLSNSSVGVDQSLDLLTISGQISGARTGLVTRGPGSTLLTANNTYTGTTTINSGILTINGSQPNSIVNVKGGVLQGVGTVGATTVAATAAINPSGASTGTLNVKGDLSVLGQLRIDVTATSNDRIAVTGLVNIASAPIIVNGSTTLGKLQIITNDGTDTVTGTTNGTTLTSSTGQPFKVNYAAGTGNDVVLIKQSTSGFASSRSAAFDIPANIPSTNALFDLNAIDRLFAELI